MSADDERNLKSKLQAAGFLFLCSRVKGRRVLVVGENIRELI